MIANKSGNYGVIKVGPVHKRRRSKNISFLYSLYSFSLVSYPSALTASPLLTWAVYGPS